MEGKAKNRRRSRSTARFLNAAIRNKARAMGAEIRCAESIVTADRISSMEKAFKMEKVIKSVISPINKTLLSMLIKHPQERGLKILDGDPRVW